MEADDGEQEWTRGLHGVTARNTCIVDWIEFDSLSIAHRDKYSINSASNIYNLLVYLCIPRQNVFCQRQVARAQRWIFLSVGELNGRSNYGGWLMSEIKSFGWLRLRGRERSTKHS